MSTLIPHEKGNVSSLAKTIQCQENTVQVIEDRIKELQHLKGAAVKLKWSF